MEIMKAFIGEAYKNKVPIKVFNGNFTEQSGHDIARTIIKIDDLPEAVFCANDQMAIGFIKAMKENNLQAPENIAVVGFDDIPIAQYMQPSLTTIGASRFLWGSSAATQLIDFLEKEKPFHLDRIPTRLIQRESSAKNHYMLSLR